IQIYGDLSIPQATPTSDNHIRGNTIINNGFDGVEILNGIGQILIFDGTTYTVYGPSLGDPNNYIENNTISGNGGDGVVIDGIGSDNNFVYSNTISGNGGAGVALLGGARGNVIGDVGTLANSISANVAGGVVIQDQGQNYFPTPDGSADIYIANA